MTRAEARAVGLLHYSDGKICPKQHVPIHRLVSNSACLACGKEAAALLRASDPSRNKASKARYKARHPERMLQQAREAYHRNKEQQQLRHRLWLAANPLKRREHEAVRRAKSSRTETHYTAADVARLLLLQRGRCAYCKRPIRRKFHVDHIIPISKGGLNDRKNIQLLCQPCNQAKHARHPLDFAKLIGLLI